MPPARQSPIDARHLTHALMPISAKLFVVVCSLFVLGFAPLVLQHFRQIWQNPLYQFFPIVLGFVAWFLVLRWREAGSKEQGAGSGGRRVGMEHRTSHSPPVVPPRWGDSYPVFPPRWGDSYRELTLAALAVFLLAVAVAIYNPWLGAVACLPLAAAGVLLVLRFRDVPQIWGLWAMLLLVIPLPLGLDVELTTKLQRVSSVLSSQLLDLLRVDHILRGNVIQLPSRELFVDEACSGMVSIMSIIACAAMYCIWRRRSLPNSLALILAGVGWAVAMNVARICSVAIAEYRWQTDWAHGRPHDMLGLATFSATALALVGTDMLLQLVLAPIDVPELYRSTESHSRWIDRWNRWVGHVDAAANPVEAMTTSAVSPPASRPRGAAWLALSVAAAALGFWQYSFFWAAYQAQQPDAEPTIQAVLAATADMLPEQIGHWQRQEHRLETRDSSSLFGKYSHVHQYVDTRSGLIALVSLDFPFYGEWHELCRCYRSTGWKQREREVRQLRVTEAEAPSSTLPATGNEEDLASSVRTEHQATRERKELQQACVTGDYDGALEDTRAYLVFGLFDHTGKWIDPPASVEDIGPLWRRLVARLRRRQIATAAQVTFQVQVFSQQATGHTAEQRAVLERLFAEVRGSVRSFLEARSYQGA